MPDGNKEISTQKQPSTELILTHKKASVKTPEQVSWRIRLEKKLLLMLNDVNDAWYKW